MRDDRSIYNKTIQQTIRQYAIGAEELSVAMSLPCALALGVHRPNCKCGASTPAKKEEK